MCTPVATDGESLVMEIHMGGMRECGRIKKRRRRGPLKGFLSLMFITLAIKEEAGAGRHSASGEITSGGIISRVTAAIFLQI